MDFNTYQRQTGKTAIYPRDTNIMGLNYAILGLGNEAGELQGVLKKTYRDSGGLLTQDIKAKMASELGDVLWYAARIAEELDTTLADVAQKNLDKLADRASRNVLGGSGDNR